MIRIQPQTTNRLEWERVAAKEGLLFEVMEFSLPPLLDGDKRELSRSRIFEWYRSSQRVHGVHGAFIDVNPASGDAAFRALSRTRCRESCELADALGAKQVIFHASAFPFLRGAYLENWAKSCAEFYRELAQTYPNLTICIENSQDLDPTPLEQLMRECDDRVGICLDLGHANYSKVSLIEWFERLGARIACLHLSDNQGQFDDHLPLGAGTLDWKLADRLFCSLSQEMPLTLEVGGLDGVEQSLAFLRQHHYFGL